MEYLVFTLSHRNYAIELLQIIEIQTIPSITPLPIKSECVLGLINLRGEVVPVLDLNYFFEKKFSNRKLLVSVKLKDNRKIAFLIESIYGIKELTDIKPIPNHYNISTEYILGGSRMDTSDFVSILDIEKLFSKERIGQF